MHRLAYDMDTAIKIVEKEDFYADHKVYSGIDFLEFGATVYKEYDHWAIEQLIDLALRLSKEEYKQHIKDISWMMFLRMEAADRFFEWINFV